MLLRKYQALYLACAVWGLTAVVQAEVVLQWFGTTWREMTEKMPILAEIGYGAIYVPVPNKGGSQWSVGYDLHDRFDLGDQDQNGTIATRYGTKHELLQLVETAHRFGIRIYFDNVMNHNSFGVPGGDANTPVTLYPDMLPEDFHLIQNGLFFKKSGGITKDHYNNGDHQAIQHYTLSDLLDVSNESGNWDIPGPDLSFIRQPTEPDKYPDLSLTPITSGGVSIYPFNPTNRAAGDPTSEDVNAYLIRAARWLMNETKCDGFRFDAAKHVIPYFFGDATDTFAGYCGGIQAEYNLTHGLTDTDNRNSVFNTDAPRDDAMLFGECVPHHNFNPNDYTSRGMRLLDFYFEGTLEHVLQNNLGYASLNQLLDYGPLGAGGGVTQVQNHDHTRGGHQDLMFAYTLLRDGLPLIYTDGNNHALPDKDGRFFPEYGRGDFLGQYQNPKVVDRPTDLMNTPGPESELTRLIWIHEQFGRGEYNNKHNDDAVLVNQRRYLYDYDRARTYNHNEGTILLLGYCDNLNEWGPVKVGPWATSRQNVYTDFRPGTLLFNYATRHNWMNPLAYTRVLPDWRVNLEIPSGHYVAYSVMVPGKTQVAPAAPILIEQPGGNPVTSIATYRLDTPQGDADWDDDGTPNANDPVYIPRVTGNEPLRFVSRTDGLAVSAMLKLDGGVDVSGAAGLDNPKGVATDVYLGYEPMSCVFKRKGDTYFYHRDSGGDPWYAITSDMDSNPDNDLGDANSDFSQRAAFEFEYDVQNVAATNLAEGYHLVRTRLFRKRQGGPNDGADIFNTFKQSFYVDRFAPTGAIAYPQQGEGLWSREYDMVIRTDDSVTRVEVHLDDADTNNDDRVTLVLNGNGTASNGAGQAWAPATRVTPYPPTSASFTNLPQEWRFTYRNIPGSGQAVIRVRLHEASSASDSNRITTLVRTNDCNAPSANLQVAWPPHGSTISFTNYEVVVQFTDCTDGANTCLDRNVDRFSLFIDNAFQPRHLYRLTDYQPGDGRGELRFAWSNFNRGVHTILARYDDQTFHLQASAQVETLTEISFAKLVTPPPLDLDGNPFVLRTNYPPPALSYLVTVDTSLDVNSLKIDIGNGKWSGWASPTATSLTARTWSWLWSGMQRTDAGAYEVKALGSTDGQSNTYEITAAVFTRLEFRQYVTNNVADTDDDDDGIPDGTDAVGNPGETYVYNLDADKPDPVTWSNGDVHKSNFSGHSDPQNPDTDNDGLPDGLELGIGGTFDPGTDTVTDTDGDGFPNFRGDADPPLFNTADNATHPKYVPGGDRRTMIAGSVTDPQKSDTDGDGLTDGREDDNNDGVIQSTDRNGKVDAGETDPNKWDTDGDGRGDGTEDTDRDGRVAGDTDHDRAYDAGDAWTETDPLNPDTDGDGLPDGWESRYGLSPYDNGTDNRGTPGASDGLPRNGAGGDPDGDGFNNLVEYTNNTDPTFNENSGSQIPARQITIGCGDTIGNLAGVPYYQCFMDWTAEDCHIMDALDDEAGLDTKAGPEYAAFGADGFARSRDLIAFYSRDGRSHGDYYFRVDFQDLKVQAEEGNMDIYVVIDTGNPGAGEAVLPDQVNARTDMKWEVVVALYQTGIGAVYVDHDRTRNTSATDGDLAANGVNANNSYFRAANFRADLDAVEFSINRQALLDAGWNGVSPLNYQVFTTKDGTCDTCYDGKPGPGDVGGHSDIADATMDDSRGWDGELNGWFSSEWKVNRAKFAVILHGNQAMAPASEIQPLLHRGSGDTATGYFRPLAAHRLFRQPVNLHLSGTLASAIEWAASDSNTNLDGRAFNDQVATMIRSNQVALLPGPFADLLLPHFTGEVARAAIDAGRTALGAIYEVAYPNWWDVLWLPERAVGADTFRELSSQGIYFTVIDQWTHLYNWFGREAAVGAGAYRINEINGMKCFAISKLASDALFERTDYGLSATLRGLFHQKAMEGWAADQVIVACRLWEDFLGVTNSLNYDGNLAWIANHPWIQVVTLEDIARGRIDLNQDGAGDYWSTQNRGDTTNLTRQAQEYVQFASGGDYDTWYFGRAGEEESLYDWQPRVEGASTTAKKFGHLGATNTLVRDTWTQLRPAASTSAIGLLGRLHFYTALFETGFHDEDQYDMSRWSNGAYKYPDNTYDHLAGWAKVAQAQLRQAGIHGLVGAWATNPPAAVVAQSLDVDQDGEAEYVLYNRKVFAVLEDNGGRMVMAFARHPAAGRAYQVIGNSLAYAEGETEDEGAYNVSSNGTAVARRTSALKDWWAVGPDTFQYVNDLYTGSAVANGWRLTSSDGKVQKTITLADAETNRFQVAYTLGGGISRLYIRNGLSPNLYDLVHYGQAHLGNVTYAGGTVRLPNDNRSDTVTALLYSPGGPGQAGYNPDAADHQGGFAARNMRNQAQVHQVELFGDGAFSFQLGLEVASTDTDLDGTINDLDSDDDNDGYSDAVELLVDSLTGRPQSDPWSNSSRPGDLDQDGLTDAADTDDDGDGMPDDQEGFARTNPRDRYSVLELFDVQAAGGGRQLTWSTVGGMRYTLQYKDSPDRNGTWQDVPATALDVWELDVPEGEGHEDQESFVDNGTTLGVGTQRLYRVRAHQR